MVSIILSEPVDDTAGKFVSSFIASLLLHYFGKSFLPVGDTDRAYRWHLCCCRGSFVAKQGEVGY